MHGYGVGAPGRISLDSCAVDQWLSYALAHGVQELRLQTSTRQHDMICPLCRGHDIGNGRDYSDSDNGSDEEDDQCPNTYVVPAKLLSCANLRSVHLVSYSLPPLHLPSTIHLPSLETLALSNITYSSASASIQRLITACPGLADLTLEACRQIKDC
ncbi:hypothetical protein ACQ4PT_045640 [Festuca glaucescens]